MICIPNLHAFCKRQLSIPNRVLNIAMPEVRLQRPCIVSSVGQCGAAGMPEHVRVRLEGQLGMMAVSFRHPSYAKPRLGCFQSEGSVLDSPGRREFIALIGGFLVPTAVNSRYPAGFKPLDRFS